MKAIYKYEFEWSREIGWNAQIPVTSNTVPNLIRMDEVKDIQYDGKFVWCIVDTEEDLNNLGTVWYDVDWNVDNKLKNKKRHLENFSIQKPLAVKEKQMVHDIKPTFVTSEDGQLFVQGNPEPDSVYEICFFKTGQEIDIPIEEYEYIGLCRLWIVQELGLYAFSKKVN